MATTWREPPAPAEAKPAPREARCKACGEWVATASSGAAWVRGRCMNRRCKKYGEGQTIHFR